MRPHRYIECIETQLGADEMNDEMMLMQMIAKLLYNASNDDHDECHECIDAIRALLRDDTREN